MRRRLRRLDERDWRAIDRVFVAALFVIAERRRSWARTSRARAC